MSDKNPYESPQSPPSKPSGGNIVALVLLILFSIPAGMVAFFAVCAATIAIGNANEVAVQAGFLMGGIVGAGVFGGGIYLAIRVYQKSKR